MPDLSNLLVPQPSPSTHFSQACPMGRQGLQPCSSSASSPRCESPGEVLDGPCCKWDHRLRLPISSRARRGGKKLVKSLEDHVNDWVERKVESGKRPIECSLPFLTDSPKMVDCRLCNRSIYPGDEIVCSIHGCEEAYHITCVTQNGVVSGSRGFKCPRHACIICKQVGFWHCIRCHIAAHTRCAPWPDSVISISKSKSQALCWRHPADWRLEKHAVLTSDIEEAFGRLPIPYVVEEFMVDSILKDFMKKEEPAPYIHIRRNSYLVKKKRDDAYAGAGCTCNSNSTCGEECECRGQSISCSKACNCSDLCTNRPFRKEKKIKVVKTQSCGWGVEASEAIKKGEFVIEYIGEVISDALCEKRLWDMKYRGDQKFYMCEIRKDFTIDATFKGNSSRFLNHSCDPNCKLEKWHVDGETRVGVFASRAIEPREPLTYDYRYRLTLHRSLICAFWAHGQMSLWGSNCRGYLGSKKKINELIHKLDPCWGCKRKRSSLAVVRKSTRVAT
ncbi:unnamed protein product [Spirodela intermedia]|uniref:Uncharacterized protein n=1 Tax=Spirodela intermedia TaxID=51605 RepID=A0A7I8JN63_SPIIN|nr:unnamed protein product [Spirodela intermedia]CAA6671023.1 unnamed protein product [Spirodela intermedia]